MLSNSFNPYAGGHARTGYELARALLRLGWKVILVCTETGSPESDGLETFVVPRLPGTPLLTSFRAGLEAARLEQEVDLFHSNGCFGFSYALRKSRAPFVAHMHSSTPRLCLATLRDPFFRLDMRSLAPLFGMIPAGLAEFWALHKADLVLANSAETANAIARDYRISSGAIRVLDNGCRVADASRSELEPKTCSRERAVRLLTVCRLTHTKGLDYLLEAMWFLHESGRNFELKVAGDGPLRTAIEKKIRSLCLTGRVVLVGHVEGSELQKLYESADLFVYCANPGLTLAEALAHGLPFVLKADPSANPSGVPMNLLRESGLGMITTDANPKSFADLIISAADDIEWRHRQARMAREFVAKWMNWDRVAQTLLAHYEFVLKARRE